MQYAGRSSWLVRINYPPWPMISGLYARDAAGLAVDLPSSPPALEPAVRIDPRLRALATDSAAADWPAWWEAELNADPEPRSPLAEGPAPQTPTGPDLRALLDESDRAARLWSVHHSADHKRRMHTLRPAGEHETGSVVRSVGAELGREVEPFELRVDVLPVAGLWSRRVRPGHLLISLGLYNDGPTYEIVLEPVVRSLA